MDDRLIDRWLSGEAGDEDRAALRALIASDPTALARLYAAAERECELYAALAPVAAAAAEPIQAGAASRRAPRARATGRIARRPSAPLPLLRLGLPLAACLALALAWRVLLPAPADAARGAPAPARPTTSVAPQAAPPRAAPPARAPVEVHPPSGGPAAGSSPAPTAEASATPPTAPSDAADVAASAPVQAPAAQAVPPPDVRTPSAPVVAARPRVATVRVDGELSGEDGGPMRYTLRVPGQLPEQRRLGLVLAFHGSRGNQHNLPDNLHEAMSRRGVANDQVIAGLKSQDENWQPGDEAAVRRFIAWALRTYPIDPRRICVCGVSNGGWFAGWFASRNQDSVAGAVLYCGGFNYEFPKAANAAETQADYYLVHGDADTSVDVRSSRQARDALAALGYRCVYRELRGVGHDVWSDPGVKDDVATWIDRLRHKQLPPSEEDLRLLAALNERKAAERALLDGAGDLLRIGGIHAARVAARGLRARDPAVRAAAASACGRLSGGTEQLVAALVPLLEDREATVRRAAIGALAMAARWRSAEAQLALCRFSINRARDRADRIAAIADLAANPCLALAGSEDALVFEALVHLLDDEDQGVRAAAFAPLAPLAADGLGYAPDAPAAARRDAAQRWRAWRAQRHPAAP